MFYVNTSSLDNGISMNMAGFIEECLGVRFMHYEVHLVHRLVFDVYPLRSIL